MAYTPPDSHDVVFDFTNSGYIPPTNLNINLSPYEYVIAGTVREMGVLVERVVALYNRSSGALIAQQLSNLPSTGHFSFSVFDTSQYYVVVLDDSTYNALILDHIIGV